MKLSIIVPIYNVEPYLQRCVDSILNQTFTDFELILVDDGSPDNSPAICDDYAQKDSRINVIHKVNGGLSDARNAGLAIAQGEYVGFVDGDDRILPDMYLQLIELAVHHSAPVVACGTLQMDPNGEIIGKWPMLETSRVYYPHEFIDEYFPYKRIEIQPSVTNKIFRRELFEDCPFPVGKIFEDDFILLEILRKCDKVVINHEYGYCYYVSREGSITNSAFTEKRFQLIDLGIVHYNFFCKIGNRKQQQYALENYLSKYMVIFFAVHIEHKEMKKEFLPYRKSFRKYILPIMTNPATCRMKKLVVVLMYINKYLAYRLCRKYFPESLPVFLRA